MSGDNKLGAFLTEVSNWRWDEFWKAERDMTYTSNQSVIFALVRACAMQDLKAIRIALNRLDGKLKTPIRIEYPKIYYVYPNASIPDTEAQQQIDMNHDFQQKVDETREALDPTGMIVAEETSDLPSLSLRQTLDKMSDYPRELPERIAMNAQLTEEALREQHAMPPEDDIPMVKSVVAAHLLVMAQNRDLGALTEVFDQIDGKLAETIQFLGEDIYITSYAPIAPPGAYVNDDGVMQLEANIVQDMWRTKLEGFVKHA